MMSTLQALPQIETLLQDESIACWIPLISRPLAADAARRTLRDIRTGSREQGSPVPAGEDIVRSVGAACAAVYARRLKRVINGTGIILHTNLGRSPLPEAGWENAGSVNCGYSNLEFELESGKRGRRSGLVPELLSVLTGAESSMVVNNNAAALFLILSALAGQKEVIVSRGEQVQIGGGFRIPEILRLSGAKLVEVGTTNVTTLADYMGAVTEQTAMILQVHRSNFALRGFTAAPDTRQIALAKPDHVILCVDQGSGVTMEELPGETPARVFLSRGADLICFSADKVLGGPQAGCVAGKRELIRSLIKNPLFRVCRPGKTVYSLLEDVLIRRLNGEDGEAARITRIPKDELKKRARRLVSGMGCPGLEIVESTMTTGGGSSPDETFPSYSIRFNLKQKPEDILALLRSHNPPVLGMISDGRAQLNIAAVDPRDFGTLKDALRAVVQAEEQCML
ncbi:MAG: L-seryl-tRNA(Sec) selenium transferase [Spirochaetales bacterium]|nr:MAG: L-seryl-tRNA(Sec) selenium transferase [Spirochaetales bacterium]